MNQDEIHQINRYINRMLDNRAIDCGSLPQKDYRTLHVFNERAIERCERVSLKLRDKREIHFRFIADNAINALATSDIVNIVAVNTGVPISIMETFSRMMCDPKTFPYVGNAALETQRAVPFLLPERAEYDPRRWIEPICPVRKIHAHLLARIAFDFTVGHELGHIARGHHKLLGNGQSVMQECPSKTCTSGMLSQALELDADFQGMHHAILGAVNLMLHGRADRDFESPNHRRQALEGLGTISTVIEVCAFVAWVYFRLFDAEVDAPLEDISHPPPVVRAHHLVSRIVVDMQFVDADQTSVKEASIRGLLHAEQAIFNTTSGNQPALRMDHESTYDHHFLNLIRYLEVLTPEIASAAHPSIFQSRLGPKLPPRWRHLDTRSD